MQTAQQGDRVQVHYEKRFQDGSAASSRGRAPIDMTVGVNHPRLPGLGLALVGMAPGTRTKLTVPAESAYGLPNPNRIRRLSGKQFPNRAALKEGKWMRVTDSRGRRRVIRIVEVRDRLVVVDANHRWAGQAMEVEVELVSIQSS